VQIGDATDWRTVATGSDHTLALKTDGTLWAWGWNNFGQLGDGTTANRSTPVQVAGLSDVIAVSAGSRHSLALRADGTVWAWGSNSTVGLLGNDSDVNHSPPVQVRDLENIIAVSAGVNHSTAVRADGTVWAWGSNTFGTLGLDTRQNSLVPIQIQSADNAVSASVGDFHSIILTGDGTVMSWGYGVYGQLGTSDTNPSAQPRRLNLENAVSVTAFGNHSLALMSDGTIRAWGNNSSGQLGNTDTEHDTRWRVPLPVPVTDVDGIGILNLNNPSQTPDAQPESEQTPAQITGSIHISVMSGMGEREIMQDLAAEFRRTYTRVQITFPGRSQRPNPVGDVITASTPTIGVPYANPPIGMPQSNPHIIESGAVTVTPIGFAQDSQAQLVLHTSAIRPLTDAEQEFLRFVLSPEGQAIIDRSSTFTSLSAAPGPPATAPDENPQTGIGSGLFPAILGLTAVIISRKRRPQIC
jgi:alpha-tubulin suppressor-like RCC1 family protein